MLIISFFVLVVLGTLSLKFIPGLYVEEGLNWHDSVFMSTSAVCVTGLVVVDTGTYFTFAGQLVLLILIQLGGLGMLVLTSAVITALGGRPSIRSEAVAAGSRSMMSHIGARDLILGVMRFTFLFEGLGALALYGLWAPQLGVVEAIWPAIFHSVSSFCNAGFSTNTTSLMEFQQSPGTLVVVSILIVAGGIGFVTMEEVYRLIKIRRKANRRFSLHSKLVLATSAILIVAGWILFACFEWNGVLADLEIEDKLANAFFMSITPRTAGFNSIDYSQTANSTNFLTIILMMIGGSPGSTAGGMKTTTFALLGLLAWSRLRSNPTVIFAHRSIPDETIQRAIGLFVIANGIVVAGVFFLCSIADAVGSEQEFLVWLFETVSAVNTVGLSMGVTPELSVPARWMVTALMFIGRIGPLAIASALIVRLSRGGDFRLAYEDVNVG